MTRRALLELVARRARTNFWHFCRLGFAWAPGSPRWPTWTWHMTLIVLCGEMVARGLADVIIGNAPPGAGKSTILARLLWPWAVLEAADTRAATLVHTIETLGHELQNARREVMTHPSYQALIPRDPAGLPVWSIDPKNNNKDKLQLIATRGVHAAHRVRAGGWHQLAAPGPSGDGAGMGTGFHPQYHHVDDVLKANGQHTSAMEICNRWLRGPMSTRFPSNQPERVIAFSQVVAALDHSQALLDHYPNARHIMLPMEYDPARAAPPTDLGAAPPLLMQAYSAPRTDPGLQAMRDAHEQAGVDVVGGRVIWRDPRTQPGELLMPALMGPDRVAPKKRSKVVWTLEYQQDRTGGESNRIFDSSIFRRWSKLPAATPDEIVVAVDSQEGDLEAVTTSDRTVMAVVARFGSRVYMLEEVCAPLGTSDAVRALFLLFQRWSGSSRKPCARIERAKSGPSIRNNLDGLLTGLTLVRPENNTRWRLENTRTVVEAGEVYLPAADAARPHLLAEGEEWPGTVFNWNDPKLPRTLRGADRLIVRVAPARVWVPEWIEEICTAGRPDDRQDGFAYAVMPWVGVIHRPERKRRRWQQTPAAQSLAAQYGISRRT